MPYATRRCDVAGSGRRQQDLVHDDALGSVIRRA